MDTTHDAMRSIRSKTHKLILNLMPERAYCQFSFYKESCYPPLAEMNVLHLQGKLNPTQAKFMASTKPEIEMFDLKNDPHEINNVADDPAYAEVKSELLRELDRWRTEVINDQGVSEAFRATNVFPKTNPLPTVGEWVHEHSEEYDFKKNGVPGWYPTRSLDQWQAIRKAWEPWVFRSPTDKMKRPVVPFTDKP